MTAVTPQPPRPLLGLALSLTTVVSWGLLPLALKALLPLLKPTTITWWRFLVAAAAVGVGLRRRGPLPRPWAKGRRVAAFFAVAAAGLVGNYLLYLWGLATIPPGAAQLVVQLAPVSFMLGSLAFFGERFHPRQWAGVATFFTGFGFFFHHRLAELVTGAGAYARGVGLVVVAAVAWGAYALAQKRLLRDYRSDEILFVVYLAGVAAFARDAAPGAVLALSGWHLAVLGFCCLNTLVAYGAFAEAVAVWEGTRVSAVLTLTPVATLAFSVLARALAPGSVELPELGALNLLGAALVVIGAGVTALR